MSVFVQLVSLPPCACPVVSGQTFTQRPSCSCSLMLPACTTARGGQILHATPFSSPDLCAARTADVTCWVKPPCPPLNPHSSGGRQFPAGTLPLGPPSCFLCKSNQNQLKSNLTFSPFFPANQIAHMLIRMCAKCKPSWHRYTNH